MNVILGRPALHSTSLFRENQTIQYTLNVLHKCLFVSNGPAISHVKKRKKTWSTASINFRTEAHQFSDLVFPDFLKRIQDFLLVILTPSLSSRLEAVKGQSNRV